MHTLRIYSWSGFKKWFSQKKILRCWLAVPVWWCLAAGSWRAWRWGTPPSPCPPSTCRCSAGGSGPGSRTPRTGNLSMEWKLCRQNYTDWTREFLHSFKKDGHLLMQNMLYSGRLKEPQGTTATERASCEVEVKYFSLFYLLCQCHLVEVELCEVCKVWPRTNTN